MRRTMTSAMRSRLGLGPPKMLQGRTRVHRWPSKCRSSLQLSTHQTAEQTVLVQVRSRLLALRLLLTQVLQQVLKLHRRHWVAPTWAQHLLKGLVWSAWASTLTVSRTKRPLEDQVATETLTSAAA